MLKHLNARFMPSDYQQKLFREFQNLKQKESSISTYTEEFMKLQIRTNLQEDEEHVVARYINRLRFQLQNELGLLKVNIVDEAYQLALKAEEKLTRFSRVASKKGGSNSNRESRNSSKSTNEEPKDNVKENFQGRGGFRGRGRGQQFSGGWKPLRCFICSETHKAVDCPQNPKSAMATLAEEGEEPLIEEVEAETGENLMLRRNMLAGDKEAHVVDWRKNSVFRT